LQQTRDSHLLVHFLAAPVGYGCVWGDTWAWFTDSYSQDYDIPAGTQSSRQDRLALADDVIDHSGSLGELQDKVEALHRKYLKAGGMQERF
jgi:hypothetical protein